MWRQARGSVGAAVNGRAEGKERAKEREEAANREREEAAIQRVEAQLLNALAKELGGKHELLVGWTVQFDLDRVLGDCAPAALDRHCPACP